MGLGISFGSKKQSASGTSTIDKTTALTGNQSTASTQSGTTNTATTGTQNTQQNNVGTTSQNTSQNTAGQTKTQQLGTTTTLNQDVQDSIAAGVQGILANGISADSIGVLDRMISGADGFDVDSFVKNSVLAARTRGEQTLQEQGSAFGSAVGGTAGTNSMAALLAQRGRNDLEASLAGVEADATAKAYGVRNQNLGTAAGAAGGIASMVAGLSDALKGGTTTVDMTSLADEIRSLTGTGTTQSNESQTGSTATSQNSSTQQLLQELANIVSSQNQQETGTETQKTKGKSGGFGLSLGL